MGRGDRKSRKGKIFKGSYGIVRPRKKAVEIIIPAKKNAVVKKKTAAKKKPTAKKQ